ncbi:uroporphyrinogen-III C-methyltransferase [Pacificitalea manganoxidans]|uniref:Uroporphyrinogen-III C-methyltransferase n=1 Tax=Pacificitalea manganoxidans TaxID=1411902 RepID=A0A291M115_9RHOB|nr:siroheme synthase CysG [Pacificitalea manganoxidans]ATI42425.1 uroporphyrinogen-III C-methyltransferase [Pacificitalea manganoxidans]MDR6307727.1 uroporphyrin-III C-methyltransferase/precorrin-2 dehydrogenase/sirohydrochlorin ferrochelatase [Pacificitalea manganoxidans]
MQHFPIFLDLKGRTVLLSGGGEAAMAKLRLLMKTEAHLVVFAPEPSDEIVAWAAQGLLALHPRALAPADLPGAALVYAADEDAARDTRTAELSRAAGVLLNVVDDLQNSQFITPAIVDRDPVCVAIGTEGAAPVLARAIKRDLEERLNPRLGLMARIGKAFRAAAEALPEGRPRRDFWSDYYFGEGLVALDAEGETALPAALDRMLDRHLASETSAGRVALVGAGPGDPELLTLKARRLLDTADVVIHDRLVPQEILELARREAILVDAGKQGFGPAMTQEEINTLIVRHAQDGHHVVRLKSGDPGVFGRLDEELDACDAAGIEWQIVPGLTSAAAAAAGIGQGLTRRGRNSAVRLLTGHDVKGFAEHDWRALARPGEVAALYMAKRGARFLQGRLLMHGAAPETPVTIVENASRPDEQVIATTLAALPATLESGDVAGPAILLYGLAPRARATAAAPAPARSETTLKEFA